MDAPPNEPAVPVALPSSGRGVTGFKFPPSLTAECGLGEIRIGKCWVRVEDESFGGSSLRGPHRLMSIESCSRQWDWRYYQYARGRSAYHQILGSMIHAAHQYYWAANMAESRRPAWFAETLDSYLNRIGDGLAASKRDEFKAATREHLNYFARWADSRNLREVTDTQYLEAEFMVRLGDLDPDGPWEDLDDEIVTVRSDHLYRDGSALGEGYWIDDLKTKGTSKVDGRTKMLRRWEWESDAWSMNLQMLLNIWVMRLAYGNQFNGVRVLRATRQTPWDFDRHVVTPGLAAYADLPRLIRYDIYKERATIALIESGQRPAPTYASCMGEYGECDYIKVCNAQSQANMLDRLRGFARPSEHELQKLRGSLRRKAFSA